MNMGRVSMYMSVYGRACCSVVWMVLCGCACLCICICRVCLYHICLDPVLSLQKKQSDLLSRILRFCRFCDVLG